MEKTIRNQIESVLIGLNIFKQVARSEVSIYTGYPVAVITPSENDSEYGSTDADKVTFIFKIRAIYIISKGANQEEVDDKLYDIGEAVLSAFKKRNSLAGACEWVQPVPGVWGREERGESIYRTREFTLRCKKYVSNT